MADYKTVGSKYPDNPYYLANVRRYIAEWKTFWGTYIPEMIETKAVPDGRSWGNYPSMKPNIGGSKATQTYNMYVHCFTPAALKGVIFLTSESMVKEGEGANFGPEMAALAKSFKVKLGDEDTRFIYTIPNRALVPKITQPKKIMGPSTAVEIADWEEVKKVVESVVK
jgi:hypothetical protein